MVWTGWEIVEFWFHESSWEGVWGEECITEMNQQRTVQSLIDTNESNVLDSELLK